jgi:hypothetical protein
MSIHELDFYFPFFVFLYGLMVSIPLNIPSLMDKAEEVFPKQLIDQFNAHRKLAMLCLYVGGLWSLQNISI